MPSRPEPRLRVLCRMSLALFGLAFTFGPRGLRGQVRPEIYPVETVTLGAQQILSGEKMVSRRCSPGNSASSRGTIECQPCFWFTALTGSVYQLSAGRKS